MSEPADIESPSAVAASGDASSALAVALPAYDLRSADGTGVPRSLAFRDLVRMTHSLVRAVGAVIMTTMTVGAGLTATGLTLGLAMGWLQAAPSPPHQPLDTILLCVVSVGIIAMGATFLVGLIHFILPRAVQFLSLLVRAPWFVPSTLLCTPVAGLWRLGLWANAPWESDLQSLGMTQRWSFRARRYEGVLAGQAVEVQEDFLGDTFEFRFEVPSHLPPAYVGRRKIAGAIGILLPLLRAQTLYGAEMLLRDGQLVIRRRWVRPNLQTVARLVAKMSVVDISNPLTADLRSVSALADWPQLRTPLFEERRPEPWFNSPALSRHLETLERQLRSAPPKFEVIEQIIFDVAVREPAKIWLLSLTTHRLTLSELHALAEAAPQRERDPVAALRHPSRWSAWIAVHVLALSGGPESLAALQTLIAERRASGGLLRAARRAAVRIIQRSGGIHTLTGHLSVVEAAGGELAVASTPEFGALSAADRSSVA